MDHPIQCLATTCDHNRMFKCNLVAVQINSGGGCSGFVESQMTLRGRLEAIGLLDKPIHEFSYTTGLSGKPESVSAIFK